MLQRAQPFPSHPTLDRWIVIVCTGTTLARAWRGARLRACIMAIGSSAGGAACFAPGLWGEALSLADCCPSFHFIDCVIYLFFFFEASKVRVRYSGIMKLSVERGLSRSLFTFNAWTFVVRLSSKKLSSLVFLIQRLCFRFSLIVDGRDHHGGARRGKPRSFRGLRPIDSCNEPRVCRWRTNCIVDTRSAVTRGYSELTTEVTCKAYSAAQKSRPAPGPAKSTFPLLINGTQFFSSVGNIRFQKGRDFFFYSLLTERTRGTERMIF